MLDSSGLSRAQLRRTLREQRRSLSPAQQRHAAVALKRQLSRMPELKRARRVALYLPNDGEIDPGLLLPWMQRKGARAFLPVLKPLSDNRLWFVHYHAKTRMTRNRFGISEPQTRLNAGRARRLPPWGLDVVLMPLVGFDAALNRLGMGGGFYDRTFAFTQRVRPAPRLIGLAHDIQHVDTLPFQSWDVPLDAVVTDRAVYR
ncbi:5-formyltetrahydrofolate cyclo-ligase [Larsenimonas salina]|uniref:5-formyltetrahydrofolate cyclo-ligase n=1 Tax=Larsenimonas salina TaxID=1295565 RepID=UPI00207344B6|nr:5-formyltetrahydrofolate cyclo-ligase [Larsenimonas salina]MCM5704639.1 5-formyltetrahydrofolate cyclo-ligase [Larsenimonas salina]